MDEKNPGRWLRSGFRLMTTRRQPNQEASQKRGDEPLIRNLTGPHKIKQ